MIQTMTINGTVVTIQYNTDGTVVVTFPDVHGDPYNPTAPFTVVFDTGFYTRSVYEIYAMLVGMGLIPLMAARSARRR